MIWRVESSDSTSKTLSTVVGRYFSHRTTSDDLPLLIIVSIVPSSLLKTTTSPIDLRTEKKQNFPKQNKKTEILDLNSPRGRRRRQRVILLLLLLVSKFTATRTLAKISDDFYALLSQRTTENSNKQLGEI